MIKFFRKIRYDLMEKNKTGKYLKYAIGEIILVVIGILIALQLNNKNEKEKTYAKVDAIFENIMSELILNIEETKNLMRFYHEKDSLAYLLLYGEFRDKKLTKEDILKPKVLIFYGIYLQHIVKSFSLVENMITSFQILMPYPLNITKYLKNYIYYIQNIKSWLMFKMKK